MHLTPLRLLAVMQAILAIDVNDEDVRIIPIKTPLLPFNLGHTRIVDSKHTFVHYVELEPLKTHLQHVEKLFDFVKSAIKSQSNLTVSSSFNMFVSLVDHAEYLIKEQNTKFDNIQPHLRSKRGLINAVGKVSKWLFGTLDSDDEIKYNNAISTLEKNQNTVSQEMSLQISLTKQLIQNYNSTIFLLSANQNLIKDHINFYELNVNKTINEFYSYLKIQNALEQIILTCQNSITFLDNLENALIFAKLNTLHSSIISIKELENIILHLKDLYGTDKIIDLKNMYSYYLLASIQVKSSISRLIFAIHFPIFNDDKISIFRLFPIPVNNSIILPRKPYLVLGTNQQQFMEEACPTVEDIYICQNHLEPKVNDCVAALIQEAESRDCKILKIKLVNQIIESITDRYILAIPDEGNLKMFKTCSNQFVHIEEPALIDLKFNCGIVINNFKFWNSQELLNVTPIKLPKIQIANVTRTKETDETAAIQLQSIDFSKIRDLQEKSLLLQDPAVKFAHLWLSASTSLFVCLLIVVVVSFIAWKIFSKKINQLSNDRQEIPRIQLHSIQVPENKPTSLLFSS